MIHILLRYLGIKTKLLDNIENQVNMITNKNDVLLDLFAGSNIVGQHFLKTRTVYSNDIQQYSYVVAKATIEINKDFNYKNIDIDFVEKSKWFVENNKYLMKIFKEPLEYEKNILEKCSNDFSYDNLIILKDLYENTPYTNHFNNHLQCFKGLEKYYSQEFYNDLKNRDKYMLFTLNYAMPYFTLNQAIYIDSFRCAIEKMHNNSEISDTEYYIYMSLLIYGLECSVSSIGDHFAQPQIFKITKAKKHVKGLEKLLLKKMVNLHDTLATKQIEFKNIKTEDYSNKNKAFCMDCIELLNNNRIMNDVDVIYIDPPYTNAHYSRFYHILETLVKYNYPTIEFNGRYSKDRYQSPFCQKKNAYKAFEKMIKICADNKKKLVISYSDTEQCLISYEDISAICNKYYRSVIINKIDYLYRNLGQKPNKVKGNELLIVCTEV